MPLAQARLPLQKNENTDTHNSLDVQQHDVLEGTEVRSMAVRAPRVSSHQAHVAGPRLIVCCHSSWPRHMFGAFWSHGPSNGYHRTRARSTVVSDCPQMSVCVRYIKLCVVYLLLPPGPWKIMCASCTL